MMLTNLPFLYHHQDDTFSLLFTLSLMHFAFKPHFYHDKYFSHAIFNHVFHEKRLKMDGGESFEFMNTLHYMLYDDM